MSQHHNAEAWIDPHVAASLRSELRRIGRKLVRHGLVHSCVGNMSRRTGDYVIITATGAMLDELGDASFAEFALHGSDLPPRASSDAPLHRAIYQGTGAGAILHTHSPYAVAESLTGGEAILESPDIEGARVLGGIPLVDGDSEYEEVTARCVAALRSHRALVIRGHGVIAIGATASEAFAMASFAEHACRIRHLVRG